MILLSFIAVVTVEEDAVDVADVVEDAEEEMPDGELARTPARELVRLFFPFFASSLGLFDDVALRYSCRARRKEDLVRLNIARSSLSPPPFLDLVVPPLFRSTPLSVSTTFSVSRILALARLFPQTLGVGCNF